MDNWQLLTGRATQPQSYSLALNESVTITLPEASSANESDALAGNSGEGSFTYDLGTTDELGIVYQTEQTDVDPNATVTITGANGTTVTEPLSIGTVGTVEEGVDVGALADGPATIRVEATGVNLRTQVYDELQITTR